MTFDDYERFTPSQSGGGAYWWVTTTTPEGRYAILGPYSSSDQAAEYGFRNFGSNFDTHQLDTRDTGKATKILKKKRFDNIHDIDEALKRASHKQVDY